MRIRTAASARRSIIVAASRAITVAAMLWAGALGAQEAPPAVLAAAAAQGSPAITADGSRAPATATSPDPGAANATSAAMETTAAAPPRRWLPPTGSLVVNLPS
ncbi:MAG TPA: hypothetical protein VFL12_07720, partial [Thermoanaerobaculia bacterium]|nr:hypothetical protein [Thermoanaerobaculia bacterium]